MNINDHIQLREILLKLKGKILLSGYENEIYTELEGGIGNALI